MADCFTHFSCLLDVGTPHNAARARDLYDGLSEDGVAEDPPSDGFPLSIQPEHGSTRLWIRDDDTGDPQCVIDFVLLYAKTFGLTGRRGFQSANTCSRPRIDAFGGGAHVLDPGVGQSVTWIGTHGWLAGMLTTGGSDDAEDR